MLQLSSSTASGEPQRARSTARDAWPRRLRRAGLGLLLTALAGPAVAGVGPQIVQNGRFALYPGTNATAYTLAAGTDLGSWRSGQGYVNTNTEPARGSLSVQIGNASYGTDVTQRTLSDFSAPSATNPITSTTNVNTFLLYRGTTTSADIWYQNVSVLPNTTYTVSFYASNAAPVGSTGTAPQLQLKATYANGGTVQAATPLIETTLNSTTVTLDNETTGNGGDKWTKYSYSFTTAATTTNVELRLTDPVTNANGTGNQVAITAITARANTASAGGAFSCNGAFYQIRQADVPTAINGASGSSTQLYLVNRGSDTYTTTQIRDLGATVNALSYEPNNGYMYALTYRGNTAALTNNTPGTDRVAQPSSYVEIIKIGTGGVESLGFIANLPVDQWAAGTVDRGLTLYLKSQATNSVIYKLNLNASPVTVTTLNLSANVSLFDLAYDPTSGLLYGGDYPGRLYSIDPTAGTVTTVANSITVADPLGSFFFDIAGNLYAYGNGPTNNTNPGSFYSINKTSGVATNIAATVNRSTNSDGASCINPAEQIDVVKQLSTVQLVAANVNQRDVTFNLYVRNTGTVTLPNVQVSDFLYTTGTGANSENVAFPTATAAALVGNISVSSPDFTVPTALATGNTANFNGQGTANGAGTVTDPSKAALLNTSTPQALTAGQRLLITYTVRLTFPAGAAPTTTQYNTAYASNSTSTNPGSRQLAANGVVLPPDDLTANDASTNGTTYAPSRNVGPVDSPVPTPVNFSPSISGTVFEDVNYGGGAGRTLTAAGGVGRPNVRVELYSAAGTYLATTTTDAYGNYSFSNNLVTAGVTYTVRVVSSQVTSSRLGSTSSLVAVQTYRYNDPNRVGGEYPARTEAAANTTSASLASLTPTTGTTAAESIVSVTLPTASNTLTSSTGVDFGYNFDTVVNTNDSGQGSLRQFLTNANALDNSKLAQVGSHLDATGTAAALPSGVETSIFMIPDGNSHPGLTAYSATTNPGLISQLSGAASGVGGTVATIIPTTALPVIGGTYGSSTSIDGTTQTRNVGNTNSAVLGTGGTVGTGNTALAKVNGPEVQLQGPTATGTTAVATGLSIDNTANNTLITGLALLDFGNASGSSGGDNDSYASIRVAGTGTQILNNVIGTTATTFAAPAVLSNSDGIRLVPNSGNTTITGNLIGYNQGKGIAVDAGVINTIITGNEVDANSQSNLNYGAIDVQGSAATVTGNLLLNNVNAGIDTFNSSGSNTISGNTVSGSGKGTASAVANLTSGIRVYGSSNTVSQNVINDNYGAGILLANTAATTVLSQNSIFNNGNVAATKTGTGASGEVGIDLLTTSDGNASAGNTPFVTLNSAATTGANSLPNYPILRSATIVGSNLLVQGYAKSGATIELFIAQPNTGSNTTGNNFGQGKTFLTTVVEGNTTAANGPSDTNTATNQSYGQSGATVNGFNQGSDTGANGFSFLIPLTSAQQTALAGAKLTSTATLSGATSEFSGNVATTTPLTGYVFEDVNYGGGAGRPRTATGAATRPGAKVELYDSNGAYVSTAITDANGQYAFDVAPGNYTVRVVNNSVLSSRTGQTSSTYTGDATTGYTNSLLPVQTYNGTTNRVGGENPQGTDAPANSGTQTLASLTTTATTTTSAGTVTTTVTPESIASVTVTGTSSTGPDFGFNFDTVVNTNDVALGSTGAQGSLRQFIANSNTLGDESSLVQVGSHLNATTGATEALPNGVETSIFMIPSSQFTTSSQNPSNTGLNGSAALIKLNSALLAVTGPGTVIDGSTQTVSTGNTNQPNTTSGSETTGPEVLLNLNGQSGLMLNASNDQLLSMGVYGSPLTSQGVSIGSGATGVTLNNNTIYNNGANVVVNSNTAATATNITITNNIIRNSTRTTTNVSGNSNAGDGIQLLANANSVTISNNQILRNGAFGINFSGASTNDMVSGNTISGNGTATAGSRLAGISLRVAGANNNSFTSNTITNNNGAGIVALAGTVGNIFSRNSISGNGVATATGKGLGIDLSATTTGDDGDGVTLNDNGDSDATSSTNGANGLINFPVITNATLKGSTLTVTGYARPNTLVELFIAAADPTGFGEGATYLTNFTQASAAGTSGGVVTTTAATYGANNATINGLYQGTDNTLGFTYTYTVTDDQKTALQASGVKLTSTATLTTASNGNYGTSEFSGVAPLTVQPLPVELVAFTAQTVQNRDALLSWTTASELNNDHFEVERSFDGSTFAKVGQVRGQGSKASSTSYTFLDAGSAAKVVAGQPLYYRLRQVDADGTSAYSPTRSVSFGAATSVAVSLFPNPATTATGLDLSALPATSIYHVQLLDATGRQVLQVSLAGGQVQQLPLSNLATGMYQVLVSGPQASGAAWHQVLRLGKQ